MIPPDEPCPGRCNRDFRAAENAALDAHAAALAHHNAHDDTQPCDPECRPDPNLIRHDVPFHPGRPYWCVDVEHVDPRTHTVIIDHHGCTTLIRDNLTNLLDLATGLAPGRLNTGATINDHIRVTRAAPPSPSPAWDEADDLIRWAVQLEDEIRDELGHPQAVAVHAVRDGRTHELRHLAPALAYLGAHVTALLSRDDAVTIGRQIMAWHRRLEHRVGRDRLIHRLPGVCHLCGRKGLQRADGGELVKCRHCGAAWAWEQHELLAKIYAGEVAKGA